MERDNVIPLRPRRLRERDERVAKLQSRFVKASGQKPADPAWLKALALVSVAFAAISGWALLKAAFPETLAKLPSPAEAADAGLARTIPLLDCDQAIALGYANIPRGSPSYSAYRDADGDGLACEPYLKQR